MRRSLPIPILATALAAPLLGLAPLAAQAAEQGSFECGGIGRESQERMVIASDRRDMLLTFADERGLYLADVDVTITGPSGAVLVRGRCGGPLMLVDLPVTGTVQVQASYRGQAQRKPITIGSKTARVAFIWNAG